MMRFNSRTALRHAIALLVTMLFLLPVYFAFTSSLNEVGQPPTAAVIWWPSNPQWQNYPDLFNTLPFGRYFTNSLLVVGAAVPFTLLTSSLAGFAMSLLPPIWRRQLLIVTIVWLMIPAAAVWLFRFQIYARLNLIDTLWALIIPAFAASNPLFVLLYYWTFRRIPRELFEAARLDGALVRTLWWRIALPLARPTTTAVAVLTFAFYWSDFIGPVLYLFDTNLYTLPIALQLVNQLDRTNTPYLMTAAMFMLIPILILFTFLQRAFLHDLSIANLFDRN